MRKLREIRPETIFLQNSFMLLLTCAAYRALPGFPRARIIVDCHNKSLKRRLEGPGAGIFWLLKKWSFGHADAVIVSNEMLVPRARELCPTIFCLRDALPQLPSSSNDAQSRREAPDSLPDRFVLFICSLEPDEPTELIVQTADRVTKRLGLATLITGTGSKLARHPIAASNEMIHTPGFLPWDDYVRVLSTAVAVVVLTDDADCLMCGAYEGMSALRPLVLSNTDLLQRYFGDYAVLSEHDPESLCDAIDRSRSLPQQALEGARRRFEAEFEAEWERFARGIGALEMPV
jgi:glycosyltransferase involved in cell wall biosynthesis